MHQCGRDLTSKQDFESNIINHVGLGELEVGLNKYVLALVAAAPTSNFQ